MQILREGMTGERVRELKKRLNALAYDCGAGDEYDRKTAWAVRWFRHLNEMENDDTVDETAWTRIFSENAKSGAVESIPLYRQGDPIWKDYPYDAVNTPEIETMCTSGCGPTGMAMAISGALKKSVLPPVLADWANANGFRDPDGINGTDESFFPVCAELYGLSSEIVPVTGYESYERVKRELAAGNAIISNVTPDSPYTKCGHYNLISSIDDEGYIHILDGSMKNMDLPPYTVKEWVEGNWCKLYLVVAKK